MCSFCFGSFPGASNEPPHGKSVWGSNASKCVASTHCNKQQKSIPLAFERQPGPAHSQHIAPSRPLLIHMQESIVNDYYYYGRGCVMCTTPPPSLPLSFPLLAAAIATIYCYLLLLLFYCLLLRPVTSTVCCCFSLLFAFFAALALGCRPCSLIVCVLSLVEFRT